MSHLVSLIFFFIFFFFNDTATTEIYTLSLHDALPIMYLWAKIPEAYAKLGSLEFAKRILKDAKVAVSPGIGFGDYGDDHVRIALIENEVRSRQAVRGIKDMFRKDGLL